MKAARARGAYRALALHILARTVARGRAGPASPSLPSSTPSSPREDNNCRGATVLALRWHARRARRPTEASVRAARTARRRPPVTERSDDGRVRPHDVRMRVAPSAARHEVRCCAPAPNAARAGRCPVAALNAALGAQRAAGFRSARRRPGRSSLLRRGHRRAQGQSRHAHPGGEGARVALSLLDGADAGWL
eukprot:scaffold1457_cov350-Prasinococcus_capsulatus_cf.AAC.2